MGDIPVGNYNSSNLANLGIGHGAADGGAGYTYFDPKTGHEFSVVTGLTYNLLNPSTGYQNGIDWHVDWGASQFVTKQLQVGAVGYFFQQITPDSGAAAFLGTTARRSMVRRARSSAEILCACAEAKVQIDRDCRENEIRMACLPE